MSKKYVFKTKLRWSGFKRGSLSSPGKLNIGVAIPPEFNGEEGYWSPEELLLSAVDSCVMTTFLHYAEIKKIEFRAYESETEGVLERIDDQFMFSKIIVKPEISVMSKDQIDKVKELMTIAENNCFISNSIKSEVEIMPEIKVGILNG
ncbi:MAG: OsmC family protein [Candidatus Omnitrophota bacterium]